MHTRLRKSAALLCLSVGMVAPYSPVLGGPDPVWHLPAHPSRVVFASPRRGPAASIVEIPVQSVTSNPTDFVASDARGTRLRSRILTLNDSTWSVLVEQGLAARSPISVYHGADLTDQPSTDASDLFSPTPFAIKLFSAPGKGTPDSSERMLYTRGQAGAARSSFQVASLDGFNAKPPSRSSRSSSTRTRSIVEMETYLLVQMPGLYRFSLACENTGFLYVNGRLMDGRMEAPGSASDEPGPPMHLAAGIHRLTALHLATTAEAKLGLEWIPPGFDVNAGDAGPSTLVIPRENFVASHRVSASRAEDVDETLHAAFDYSFGAPYRFRGSTSLFVPLRLSNRTQNWLDEATTATWTMDDATASGALFSPVLSGAGPHRVTLSVRDRLGFRDQVSQIVTARPSAAKQYVLEGRVRMLPATLFERDTVQAMLQVAGDVPSGQSVELNVTRVSRGGDAETLAPRSLRLKVGYPQSVLLTDSTVAELSRLEWSLSHRGTVIRRGAVRFVRPPFDVDTLSARGDALFDADGQRIVLVPIQHFDPAHQVTPVERLRGKVLCVEDSSPTGATIADQFSEHLDADNGLRIEPLTLTQLGRRPDALKRVADLAELASVIPSDTQVLLLALGRDAILAHEPPGQFERRIAAATDLIAAQSGAGILWVTPPPWSGDGVRVRPYAMAIRRVAAARGVPVADLYSAFMGADRLRPLFDSQEFLSLSRHGDDLAGRALARAVSLR